MIMYYPGDYLREQYEQATQVKMNKRGRLQVKDSRYKVPTALDLVYLDESPDWCRANKQLQWPGMKSFYYLCICHLKSTAAAATAITTKKMNLFN